MLQQRRGNWQAAEEALRESLDRRRQLYGDDHPLVAWAEADFGWLLHSRSRDGEAEPLLRHALAALRARLGPDHLYVTEAMQRLGAIVIASEPGEAATLLADAAQRFKTLPGHPPDGLIGCLGNLAGLQWQRGDRDAGRATQAEALALARQSLPADHYVVTVSMTNLATMLADLGELEPARALFAEALQHATAAGRAGEARIQRQRLAEVLERLDRGPEAAAVRAGR
jgi:serine/threonine-protein kinase